MRVPESREEVNIKECFEPLLEIPNDGRFMFATPHPYETLGAPYDGRSPFQLRKKVLSCLMQAAGILSERHPRYRFKIYDAYRPAAVQLFMVKHTADDFCKRVFSKLLKDASEEQQGDAMDYALQIFAEPNSTRHAPPPHSTGGAVDLTIIDSEGNELAMGSTIDEINHAHPDAFKDATDSEGRLFHKNRTILREIMEEAKFTQLPHEWWHFSFWDQTAVFVQSQKSLVNNVLVARYGRVD